MQQTRRDHNREIKDMERTRYTDQRKAEEEQIWYNIRLEVDEGEGVLTVGRSPRVERMNEVTIS